MATKVDVLVCGSGSAGLCAGLWFSRCGIDYRILERRSGPLTMGQADGVQTRTVEVFESFGISEALLKESYHVLEVAFWSAVDGHPDAGIRRTGYAQDVEEGLSHLPHVIINQARVNSLMMEEAERSPGGLVISYGTELKEIHVDEALASDPDAYCVTATAMKDGVEMKYQSKYALGCDGAHSTVRRSLGIKMVGDSTDTVWGVMDVHPRTNFPDIRKKATISATAGNLLIIPREGDSMVRFYIELGNVAAKDVTLEQLQATVRRIFHPYDMEIAETVWWSAYNIGQRLADQFTKSNRVFLTGDACHTHSPKAGQGMNVSLQDGYNIGWKLASVLRKQSPPTILETYISERQKTAAELIAFDRDWTKLFSSSYRQQQGITPEYFKEQFVRSGRYTAGQGIKYEGSLLVAPRADSASLATNLQVGMRFPSAQVVRVCDAKAMQLVRALPADSRWHVLVFAGDIKYSGRADLLRKVSEELRGMIQQFTPKSSDADSIIQSVLVLSSDRQSVEQDEIPQLFTPITTHRKIKCLTKSFVDEKSYNSGHGHAYRHYGIDPEKGCAVIVRPDHYISMISPIHEVKDINEFFGRFLVNMITN
ncbi:FAD binding domain-containing protein [Xylariaceae sp. FL0255]|nr:FAD binding domain-containing protein [Xylariaceae sp. FL0255]